MSVAFCYLRVVSRWLARVILPELILDRSDRIDSFLIPCLKSPLFELSYIANDSYLDSYLHTITENTEAIE